jgi:hypothetical protein
MAAIVIGERTVDARAAVMLASRALAGFARHFSMVTRASPMSRSLFLMFRSRHRCNSSRIG